MSFSDARHMAHALALGRRGMGQCWPNPAVGCVIVREGRVIGRGHTQQGGRPHAETQALDMAGEAARGATAYVTLEPCSHHGQTPPCAQALIEAGIARLVAPINDCDPRVSGRGFAMLRTAGIVVETGIMAREAALDHAGFFLRASEGRPWLTLKLAMTLDGRIATATGESKWITGPAARQVVQGLRARHDAVLVGAGTARADDPSLTLRGFTDRRAPVRIVASRLLDLSLTSQLAHSAHDVPLWLCHGPEARAEICSAWTGLGAQLIPCDSRAGRLDPNGMMSALGAQGLTRVLCEGGGQLAAALLGAGLVDELHVFGAGLAIGAEGQPGIGALGVERLLLAPRFQLVDVTVIDGDIHQVWHRGESR